MCGVRALRPKRDACNIGTVSKCRSNFEAWDFCCDPTTVLVSAMAMIPDEAIFVPPLARLEHRRAESRFTVALPMGHTHSLGGEAIPRRTKSVSYNRWQTDVCVGHHGLPGVATEVGERRAALQAAAWACDWYIANHPSMASDCKERCDTTIGTELSLLPINA
jgi:hypothetical protein